MWYKTISHFIFEHQWYENYTHRLPHIEKRCGIKLCCHWCGASAVLNKITAFEWPFLAKNITQDRNHSQLIHNLWQFDKIKILESI